MVQVALGLLAAVVLIGVTYALYKHRANEVSESMVYDRPTMESLLREFKNEMADVSRENEIIMAGDRSYEAVCNNQERIEWANEHSVYGIPAAREVIIALAHNFLERRLPTRDDCVEVIDFDNPMALESQVKWELLIMILRKSQGKNVIRYLEDTYHITEPKEIITKSGAKSKIREFDYQMLDNIFMQEVVAERRKKSGQLNSDEEDDRSNSQIITYEEILDVMSIMLFSMYHGFEVIDSLMQLDFDGLNFGSSGSVRYEIDGDFDVKYRTVNSVWLQIDANWTLFSFLDFTSVPKMRKVVNQLVSYGDMPPMTEKQPFKVCDGYDGSRRVAIRPPSGESWFFSCRKFTLSVYKMESLLNKVYVKNWELPGTLIMYLMKAEQTTAFTGQQNTGKTTLMKGAVEYIEDKNIRVLEMSFELALREIYTHKNVMTVKPTDYVSSAMLQDLLKKTDGWVSMVGEVAEDIVAARMIQFCLIASAFTIFSHHGLDDWGLVNGLTNSLVASGEYHDHKVAMSTVLDAIKNNVHLGFTEHHQRIIEYISQIVKISDLQPYPEIQDLLAKAKVALKREDTNGLAEILVAMIMLNREYYTRTTDRIKFTSRKIVVYNPKTHAYEPNEWYTPEAMKNIMMKLGEEDRKGFVAFYKKYWRCSKG